MFSDHHTDRKIFKFFINKMAQRTHVTSTKPPFDDLLDLLPLIDDCNNDSTNCACTDPSYEYPNKCSIKPLDDSGNNDHSGRQRCTYGPTGTSGYEKSASGKTTTDDYTHSVKTSGGRKNFDPTESTTSIYPRGLLFCNNPLQGALPTASSTNLTPDENNPDNVSQAQWSTTNTGTANQPNLGFDK